MALGPAYGGRAILADPVECIGTAGQSDITGEFVYQNIAAPVGPVKVTAPRKGWYLASYQLRGQITNQVARFLAMRITRNTVAVAGSETVVTAEGDNGSFWENGGSSNTIAIYLEAGDEVELQVEQQDNTSIGKVISDTAGQTALRLVHYGV